MKNGGSFHSYVNVYQRVHSISMVHGMLKQGATCMIHPITWGVCDHLPLLEELTPSDQRIYVETWLTLKITGPEFRVAVYHLLSPTLSLLSRP